MKNIAKKDILILSIFLLNIVCISIPYTIKNIQLKKDIALQTSAHKHIEKKETLDFYSVYDDFHSILNELEISPLHIQADTSKETMKITFVADFKQQQFVNLLTTLNKKIPSMRLLSANIDFKEDTPQEVTFYIENT